MGMTLTFQKGDLLEYSFGGKPHVGEFDRYSTRIKGGLILRIPNGSRIIMEENVIRKLKKGGKSEEDRS